MPRLNGTLAVQHHGLHGCDRRTGRRAARALRASSKPLRPRPTGRRDRRGRLVLVRGEAGVGKTALVRRFCDRDQAGRLLGAPATRCSRPARWAHSSTSRASAGGELGRSQRRPPRPYELAGRADAELEGDGRRVVVLEDVHWADEATLDVLRIVARRIDALPALLIATYRRRRGRPPPSPPRACSASSTAGDRTTRIGVDPFSPEAVEALAVDHGVDPGDLYRKTGGNAFFVTEALASGGAELPETVRDAVLARAARLGSPARRLLETIAVAPTDMELWLLETLAPGSADSLEECLASGMLRLDADRVCFRHELARLAVEASLPSNVLRALNAAISGGTDRAPGRRTGSGQAGTPCRGRKRCRCRSPLRPRRGGAGHFGRRASGGGESVCAGASLRRPAPGDGPSPADRGARLRVLHHG